MNETWHVNWAESDVGDFEKPSGQLCIGPNRDDPVDAFAFSVTIYGDVPEDLAVKFDRMAAAPELFDLVRILSADLARAVSDRAKLREAVVEAYSRIGVDDSENEWAYKILRDALDAVNEKGGERWPA